MRSPLNRARIEECDPLPPDHDMPQPRLSLVEELYRAERPKLLRFLAGRTSPHAAQDAIQHVFTGLASLDEDQARAIRSPAAYLREAIRNHLRDTAKAAARRSLHLHVSADELAIAGPDPIPVLEARDRLARIEKALLRLKPLTRQIFLAHRLDGYSYAEIAHRTGLSVKGVEKQMSRAISQLGRHLRRHD